MNDIPSIPEKYKKSIRAVLLSQRGIALKSFQNDYAKLEGKPLPYTEFGFPTLRSALESIPDTARFEYSEKAKAWIVYGIAEPGMFMSSFARIKQESHENAGLPVKKKGRGRSKTMPKSKEESVPDGGLVQNSRGLYSVIFKSGINFLKLEEITPHIENYGDIAEKHILQLETRSFLFYRYRKKEDAEQVIDIFNGATIGGKLLQVKPAEEKTQNQKGQSRKGGRSSDSDSVRGSERTNHNRSQDLNDSIYLSDSCSPVNADEVADDSSPPPLLDDSEESDYEVEGEDWEEEADDGPPPLLDDSSDESLVEEEDPSIQRFQSNIPGMSSHPSAFHRYGDKT